MVDPDEPSTDPSAAPDPEITHLLHRMSDGDEGARGEVFRRLYTELRRLAAWLLEGRTDGTLRPTDLLHGAYLKLVDGPQGWNTRAHFVRVAAQAMRQVLVDYRRSEAMRKRGGGRSRDDHALESVAGAIESRGILVVDLNEAIDTLRGEDPAAAEMAVLVVFGGLTRREAAETMGLPLRTAERTWYFANARLRRLLAAWVEPEEGRGRDARAG